MKKLTWYAFPLFCTQFGICRNKKIVIKFVKLKLRLYFENWSKYHWYLLFFTSDIVFSSIVLNGKKWLADPRIIMWRGVIYWLLHCHEKSKVQVLCGYLGSLWAYWCWMLSLCSQRLILVDFFSIFQHIRKIPSYTLALAYMRIVRYIREEICFIIHIL